MLTSSRKIFGSSDPAVVMLKAYAGKMKSSGIVTLAIVAPVAPLLNAVLYVKFLGANSQSKEERHRVKEQRAAYRTRACVFPSSTQAPSKSDDLQVFAGVTEIASRASRPREPRQAHHESRRIWSQPWQIGQTCIASMTCESVVTFRVAFRSCQRDGTSKRVGTHGLGRSRSNPVE